MIVKHNCILFNQFILILTVQEAVHEGGVCAITTHKPFKCAKAVIVLKNLIASKPDKFQASQQGKLFD